MKKILVLFIILFSEIILIAQTNTRIAVVDFQSNGTPQYVGNAVADIFTTEIKKDKDLIVLERSQIQQVIKERNIQKTNGGDVNEALKFGQILSVDRLIIGSVSKIGDSYSITGKIVEIKSGAIEYAETENCATVDDIETASRYLATKLLNKISRTYHDLPEKKYNSKSSNDKIDISLSARYGMIWGFKVPTMSFPADTSGSFKIIPKEENLSVIEGIMSADFYIYKGLGIKGLFKYTGNTLNSGPEAVSSFESSVINGATYTDYISSKFTLATINCISVGAGVQYNFSFSKFQPFVSFSGLATRSWFKKSGYLHINGGSLNSGWWSNTQWYELTFSQNAIVFSTEIMTGYKVMFSDNVGMNFGLGANMPVYGSHYNNLKAKNLGGDNSNGYIAPEFLNLENKIKFNEKDFLQPPMYFVQLGFTYQI